MFAIAAEPSVAIVNRVVVAWWPLQLQSARHAATVALRTIFLPEPQCGARYSNLPAG
jgi:hypothetical protein